MLRKIMRQKQADAQKEKEDFGDEDEEDVDGDGDIVISGAANVKTERRSRRQQVAEDIEDDG